MPITLEDLDHAELHSTNTSWENLMRQASDTAHDYLSRAVRDIDEILGKGYAAKHPGLIGAMVAAAADDFKASSLRVVMAGIDDTLNKVFGEDGVMDRIATVLLRASAIRAGAVQSD
jgi:hypothetical protein